MPGLFNNANKLRDHVLSMSVQLTKIEHGHWLVHVAYFGDRDLRLIHLILNEQ